MHRFLHSPHVTVLVVVTTDDSENSYVQTRYHSDVAVVTVSRAAMVDVLVA